MRIENSIAQCVGLWLAEGDSSSTSEITFTNNQYHLIKFFNATLSQALIFENKPRIYVYSPSNESSPEILLSKKIVHRFYIDKRANRPYFIYRVSGRELVKKWLKLVKKVLAKTEFYGNVLQGFFAGEGNIKYIEKSKSRVVRISQGKRNALVEKLLRHFKIKYSYAESERSYVISGKDNLDRAIGLKISCLHPEKQKKLAHMMSTYKQSHYLKGRLKKMLFEMIKKRPYTSHELSKLFERGRSRITMVLMDLKRDGKIRDHRVGSLNYWTGNKDVIIISNRKKSILDSLDRPRRLFQISKVMKVDDKSSLRRLKELEKLNLVERNRYFWYRKPTKKEVIVYNIGIRDR